MSNNSISDTSPSEDGDFSSELCKFLSALSTTSATDFSSLHAQMVKLRGTLIKQVHKKEIGEKDPSDYNDNFEQNTETKVKQKIDAPATKSFLQEKEEIVDIKANEKINENVENIMKSKSEKSVIGAGIPNVNSESLKVVFSLQSGAAYELVDKAIDKAFSKYGEVTLVRRKGERGFVQFKTVEQVKAAENKLVQVGDCMVHTSLPRTRLSMEPVPYQVLIDPCHFPKCWERATKVKAFFSRFGEVLAIDWLGPGQQRAVISFKDQEVPQKLIGQEFLTCPQIQEVSMKTMKGLYEMNTSY